MHSMKKKSVLLLATLLSSAVLVGATFASYAVTDVADPFGIFITPGQLDEDTDTQYVTIRWGDKTSVSSDISYATPGGAYRLGVYSLEATQNYRGVLSVEMTDTYEGTRPEGQKRLIDYLRLYLYEGAQVAEGEEKLPESSIEPILTTALGATTLTYGNALGTPSGKEYTIFIAVDVTAGTYYGEMLKDIVSISIDWSPKSGDVPTDTSRTVYYASRWDNAYLYTWNNKGCNAYYPGVQMSKIGVNQYGEYIYQGLLFDEYTQMIFSNGGQGSDNQTPNITISDFDFTQGDLLFWKDDTNPKKVGSGIFNSDDVVANDGNLGSNPGPILQAWGWTTNDVLENLDDIKEAGYKAVQLSPLQPLKSGSSTQAWSMAYQPVGLCVADNTKKDEYNQTIIENPIGDKYSLMELTEAAAEEDIMIMVDVVANHLAEGSTPGTLDSKVRQYEQTIYDGPLTHNYCDADNDDNTEHIVRGRVGGLPDLQTENEHVQGRVISMLKEYINCGVRGFRFDAAKHIETPLDGDFRSEFWPNVIGAINQYSLSKPDHKAPYCYGEVLKVSTYRDWNGYTNYIDIGADSYAWGVREQFDAHNEGEAIKCGFYIGQSAEYAVLYSESHDNFTHGDTYNYDDVWIDMEYGLAASRAGASSLYFARPQQSDRAGNNTNIIVTPNGGYKNELVSAVNKLHNKFVGGSEYLSAWDGCVINARVMGDRYGAYICNIHEQTSVNVQIAYADGILPDGAYTDLVTGKTVYISGGYASITFEGFKAAVLISNNYLS